MKDLFEGKGSGGRGWVGWVWGGQNEGSSGEFLRHKI